MHSKKYWKVQISYIVMAKISPSFIMIDVFIGRSLLFMTLKIIQIIAVKESQYLTVKFWLELNLMLSWIAGRNFSWLLIKIPGGFRVRFLHVTLFTHLIVIQFWTGVSGVATLAKVRVAGPKSVTLSWDNCFRKNSSVTHVPNFPCVELREAVQWYPS